MINPNNLKLIQDLVDVFNGNNNVFMEEIATSDFTYKTSSGAELNLSQTAALQENLTYHLNNIIVSITSKDNIWHDLRIDLEIHDPITKLHKIIPTLAKVKIVDHLISRIEITFIASVDDFEKIKQLRKRMEALSLKK